MRHFDLKNSALTASLLAGFAMIAACSTGSGSPAGGTGGTSGGGTGGMSGGGTGGMSGGGTGGMSSGGTGGMSGGGTGGTVAGGPSVCDGKGTRLLAATDTAIDNFEGTMLSPGWSAFNDVMPMNSFMIMQAAGGALSTGHAAHYAGMGAKTPAKGGFGVGAAFNAAIDKAAGTYCVDVSGFDGITFWAKAAKASTKVSFNFIVPSENAVADGGDCMTGCYLHPQKNITLGTDWAQYSVTFAEAVPAAGTAKVLGKIQGISFLSADADWDFSFDEIQYYKGTPPTTPVMTAATQ